MIQLLFGEDARVIKWFQERFEPIDFGDCVAIGVVDDDEIIAAVIYSTFLRKLDGTPLSIDISIFTTSPLWCNKSTLYSLLAYPFLQLGVIRLQSICAVNNTISMKFLTHLGFTCEGVLREAWPLGGDCKIFSLLNHECKWIKNEHKRQIVDTRSS